MPELLHIHRDAPDLPVGFRDLLAQAERARDDGRLWLAESLARRARCFEPDHAGAAAVHCSILRLLDRTEQALAISEPFAASNFTPLLTARAEVLCDLGRWPEAQETVGRSLRIAESGAALSVLERIRSAGR
ncbi:MAG: hypothetical protein ACYTGZ_18850 [Planctomycetota bacterium]|jgi:hypothetical protein